MIEPTQDLLGLNLPTDWRISTLGELFEIQQGKALNPTARSGATQLPFLRTANVLWFDADISQLDHMHFDDEERSRLRLRAGDLLVCEGGDIGRTAIWRGELAECYHQNHVFRLRAKTDKIVPEFYLYWMHTAFSLWSIYSGRGNRTTIPNLSKGRLALFEVPVPSLSEQIEIVRILNAAHQASRTSENILKAIEELRKSALRHLFLYGLIALKSINDLELQQTALGPLPAQWQVCALKSVAVSYKNGIYKPEEFYGKGYPSLRMFNIKDGRVNMKGMVMLQVTEQELNDYGLREGDILVNRVNSGDLVGKAALIPAGLGPVTFESKNIRVRVNQNKIVSAFFVMWTLTPQYIVQIRQMIRAAVGQATINQGDLDRMTFPIPPLEEQKKIVAAFRVIEDRIQAEKTHHERLVELFSTLSAELLLGKHRKSIGS